MHGSEIESLKADLRRMQARVDELEADGEEPTNRRRMLRGLGAAAAGAAVGGLAFARTASAVDVVIGADNVTTDATSIRAAGGNTYNPSRQIGLLHLTDVNATDGGLVSSALTINASGAELDVGAKIGGNTTGAKLAGDVPLKLNDSPAPTQTSGTRGQFKQDDGDLWFCVESAGSRRWRRIAGLGSAGGFNSGFNPVTPKRVYDSRAAAPTPGVINTGQNRLVSVANGRNNAGAIDVSNLVPVNAVAVLANVTVTGTTGGFGYLAINPGGNTVEGASTINWFGAGQTLANGVALTINGNREVTVICNGGGSTHFIIDVSGYFY